MSTWCCHFAGLVENPRVSLPCHIKKFLCTADFLVLWLLNSFHPFFKTPWAFGVGLLCWCQLNTSARRSVALCVLTSFIFLWCSPSTAQRNLFDKGWKIHLPSKAGAWAQHLELGLRMFPLKFKKKINLSGKKSQVPFYFSDVTPQDKSNYKV